QDLYCRGSVAGARQSRRDRICRPRRRFDQKERRTGRGAPIARAPGFPAGRPGNQGARQRPHSAVTSMGKTPHTDWLASLQSLLTTVVIAVFVITFIIQAFQIPSESMENTLLIGDYLLVDKLRYGGSSLWDRVLPYRVVHRGDIVVFHYPVHPSEHFVKRVVGVPGDRVRLINRRVFVNGTPLAEPYVRYSSLEHDAFRDDFPRTDMPVPGLEGGWWLQMRKLVEDNE